jgi:hypothetical protein
MKKNIYTLFSALTSRTLALACLLFTAFSAFGQSPEVFSTAGAFTWTCPTGVTSVTVECWGAGGAGGAATNVATRAGGGGGGGSYVTNTLTVVPGTIYNITVGAGGLTPSTAAVTAFGLSGGKSEFSGAGITTITASGGTGGGGGTTGTPAGSGGVLGGVYGFNNFIAGVASYSASTAIVSFSGGGGSGAVATIATTSSTVSNVTTSIQGSGYTTPPTVTITSATTGTGAGASALINPSIDAGGTITPGGNGFAGVVGANGGAGGAGGNGGAGGATNTTIGAVGAVGTAPGGGGAGGYANTTPASARGGIGGAGQVKLTYGAVPVELINFDVKRTQTTVLLTWRTASEKDNALFNIEQSINGTDFQTLAQIKGSGTTTGIKSYDFDHTTPSVGTNYYRLKQVDFNGTTTYSPIRSVLFGKTGLVIKTTLVAETLDIIVSDEAVTTVSLFNMAGQQVFSGKAQGAQRINISDLPAGQYIVRTATGDAARFVKQ